jgi:hypothetical protein
MAEQKDLKKHFEAILGRPFDLEDGGPVKLREDVGFRTFQLDGYITSREIGTTGEATKRCRSSFILDVRGSSITGNNGTVEFPLSDFVCLGEGLTFKHPINFVATPRSRSPIYLTCRHRIAEDEFDVSIQVFAWNSSGAPASGVPFDWRCSLPYNEEPS